MQRTIFEAEHDMFRDSVRKFVRRDVAPHSDEWESAGIVDRDLIRAAGESGFLGMAAAPQHGGGGVDDFRFNQIPGEELQAAGVSGAGVGLTLQTDVCLPYFLKFANADQQDRWIPQLVSGELISAIAVTEPSTRSDLAAITTAATTDGPDYMLNGTKTFISNGINADVVTVAAKTDRARGTLVCRCSSSNAAWRDSSEGPTSASWDCAARTPLRCSSPTSASRRRTCSVTKVMGSSNCGRTSCRRGCPSPSLRSPHPSAIV